MAMLVFKSAHYLTDLMCFDKFTGSECFGQLLSDSVCGFADGRLPGNLGDTEAAMDTGEP